MQARLQATRDAASCCKQIAIPLAQRITLWCPPLPSNFLKRELPQLSSLRDASFNRLFAHDVIAVGLRLMSTQVYKPLFPAFFSQFLDFSPNEQHIFVHDESSLCFLGLVDLSIHKQRKTQASWVSATDSYGEKITSCPPAAFCASSESCVCKQPIFCSIILLSYCSCSPEKLSPLK